MASRRNDHTAQARVVLVGQTPPPVHGQATMIKHLVDHDLPGMAKWHVELSAARNAGDVGSIRPSKLLHLIKVVAQILWYRARYRADTLYFPPSAERAPALRDAAILLATRWAFRRTVLHFHAGGLGATIEAAPLPLRALLRAGFRRPDVAIRMSAESPPDPAMVDARFEHIIPYGLPARPAPNHEPAGPPVILFAGALRESKGVLVLLEALGRLRTEGVGFTARVVGPWTSDQFRQQATELVGQLRLQDVVSFPGELDGEVYARQFDESTVFCFPTHFPSESFSVVVVEAMRAGLPVVATRWRGLRGLVRDGVTGYLVPVHDPGAVASRLIELLNDPGVAATMGRRGREVFESEYTLERYLERVAAAIRGGGGDGRMTAQSA